MIHATDLKELESENARLKKLLAEAHRGFANRPCGAHLERVVQPALMDGDKS